MPAPDCSNDCPELLEMSFSRETRAALEAAFGARLAAIRAVGGGCIHQARRVVFESGLRLFVKSGPAAAAPMLAAERADLEALAPWIRVPAVRGGGDVPDGECWLALEWLDLQPHSRTSLAGLGTALARLHRHHGKHHGAGHDNFIGQAPQDNRPCNDWAEFFPSRRIEPQLRLAAAKGEPLPAAAIMAAVARVLAGHRPPPSLLHGDLWSGNTAALPDGSPVVFDPAACHGDAETDLAMLELFGGPLPAEFLDAYAELAPLPAGRGLRRPAYDLYHALNHLNHFGRAYRPMVDHCLKALRL
jgi:protein-ribulosamine 3-kinase